MQGARVYVKSLLGMYRWEAVPSCPHCGGSQFKAHSTQRYGLLSIRLKTCGGCGLIMQSPRLAEASLKRFYETDYRRHQGAGSTLHAQGQFERGMRRGTYITAFLDTHQIPFRGLRVAELGCGYGGILEVFRQNGCSVKGWDWSREAVTFGRSKGLDLYRASIDPLPSMDGEVDLIILSHVLEHLNVPQRFLQELRQKMAPEGYLYTEVPGMDNPRVKQRRYAAQPAHLWYFTLPTMQQLMESCGFRLIDGNPIIQGVFRR